MQKECSRILQEVEKVIKGKEQEKKLILAAILAKGHILLDDIPGVGKTTLTMAFSRAMQLEANRMQFTSDVLPSDVLGFQMIYPDGTKEYQKGVILCNLFMADEINRASSKTQSALLEVMEEGKVTIEGVAYPAPEPFVVMATQNPVGFVGTQLLPESQVDRELINRIQNLRKETGLEITDRIKVTVASNEDTNAAIEAFGDYIKGQVLADSIEIGDNAGVETEFDDFKLNILVEKN